MLECNSADALKVMYYSNPAILGAPGPDGWSSLHFACSGEVCFGGILFQFILHFIIFCLSLFLSLSLSLSLSPPSLSPPFPPLPGSSFFGCFIG